MDAVRISPALGWLEATAQWFRSGLRKKSGGPRIGLALGGGFARGIAHIGVLRALEKNNIPIHAVAGVSSGAIVAAAMASGSSADEIQQIALSMKFRDVARWTVNLLGLAGNDRMITFLSRLLKTNRFEEMQIPLAIIATDLAKGQPVTFHGKGDVVAPIRASCAYPGLFLPLRYQGRMLVDGFVSMEVPAAPLLQMGADRVISVVIPNQEGSGDCGNMFSVISRCFQLMSARTENSWRRYSNIVISPPVADMSWDSFASANRLIELGEQSAMAAMPQIKRWLAQPAPAAIQSIAQAKGTGSLTVAVR
ncbi:MAG TPA: patatin-like phospholipase family protein [Bryobacteraceae bacterium]|nr:patatin-like phospholipase family protein [Bryobacteraceae bacterium]